MFFFSYRCACFDGPSCPGSLDDPCQPFRLPPPPPQKFTLYYNAKLRQCSPMGCQDSYYSGKEIQSLTEYKKRDDTYEKYWLTTFYLPGGNGSSFVQVTLMWSFWPESIDSCSWRKLPPQPKLRIVCYSMSEKSILGKRKCECSYQESKLRPSDY